MIKSVTITLTDEELNALFYFWKVSSDLGEVLIETGIDLLGVLGNLAHTSLTHYVGEWDQYDKV